mmetsp:Transcript_40485/g.61745  ORF Transcript_40485/g.61745 Transcript_40485/m.61745 type:complete len:265 (-) Transcript_40485:1912-2706(-)
MGGLAQLGSEVLVQVVVGQGLLSGTNIDQRVGVELLGVVDLLASDFFAVDLIDCGLRVGGVVVTGKRHVIEVELVFERLELAFDLFGLLHGLLDDLINISLHVFVFLVAGVDDLLGSVLDHGQHFVRGHLVFFIVRSIELASLHDQVIDLQLASRPLDDLLFDRFLGYEPVDDNVSLLADSMGSVDCLQVHLRVPVGIEDYNHIGRMQINSNSSSPGRQNEELLVGVFLLEVFDARVSLSSRGLAIDTAVLVASNTQAIIEDVQ